MRVLLVVTYVGLALTVVALTAYLIAIVVLLRRIRHTAGLILFGVRAIAHRTEPLGRLIGEIDADLAGVRDALAPLAARAEAAATEERKDRGA